MDNLTLAKFEQIMDKVDIVTKKQNDNIASITGGLRYKGVLDASNLGIRLNNGKKGDFYKVSVAGTVLTSLVLNIGDMIIINKDVVGTPTVNDLDVIDNTESANNPILIDSNVDILTLPSGCYIFDGAISTSQNYPVTLPTVGRSNVLVYGKDGNRVIIFVNSYLNTATYIRIQTPTGWLGWQTYFSYTSTSSNRTTTESPAYYWSINNKQVYSKFTNGTAPTNNSALIITPTTGVASKLVSYDGWILKKGTNQRIPLNSLIANATDLTNASPIYQDSTTGSIYLYMNNDTYNGQNFELTVYYTK